MISIRILLVPMVALLLAATQANAQFGGSIQRAEQTNIDSEVSGGIGNTLFEDTAPSLYPGEEADLGPQFLVITKPRQTWVSGYGDVQYFYTSNATLTETDPIDTGLFVSTLQAAFDPTPFWIGDRGVSAPQRSQGGAYDSKGMMDDKKMWEAPEPTSPFGGYLAPRVGFRYQWYIYNDEYTLPGAAIPLNLDFDVMTVFSDVRFAWGDGWVAGVGFEWNRLLGYDGQLGITEDLQEFYTEYVPTWRIAKTFTFSDEMFLSFEYFGAYRFTWTQNIAGIGITDTNINDRLDTNFRIAYTQEVFDKLYVQPWYRFQYSYYPHYQLPGFPTGQVVERNDILNTFGLTITYALTDWASIRAFVNYDIKDADQLPGLLDYHNLNAGGGLSLTVKF